VSPPLLTRGARIASTSRCIIVGCWPEQDGPTQVTIGQRPLARQNAQLAFDGVLDTPHQRVAVWTVEWRKVLEARVRTERTRLRIFTNHPKWPDQVSIELE
jgi:hypothetical protein